MAHMAHCVAATVLVGLVGTTLAGTAAATGPSVDGVADAWGLSTADRDALHAGKVVRQTVDTTASDELAVRIAVLIAGPRAGLIEAFRSGRNFRFDDQVRAFGEIKGDGALGDFAALELAPVGDAEARAFAAADLDDLNLSTEEADALRAAAERDSSRAAIETHLRSMLLARHRAYRARGLAGIAPYARSSGDTRDVGAAIRRAITVHELSRQYAPTFRQALLDYPQGRVEGVQERFFWVVFEIDGRPTLVLNHRMGLKVGDAVALSERHYYVSRSYNETQAVAGLVPVEEGTVVFYTNRTTTDQVGGFGSSTKQALGSRVMGKQLAAIFARAQQAAR